MADYYLQPSFAEEEHRGPIAQPVQQATQTSTHFMGFSYRLICVVLLGVIIALAALLIWVYLQDGYIKKDKPDRPVPAQPAPAKPAPSAQPTQPAQEQKLLISHDEVVKTADDAELQKYINIDK